MLVTILLVNMLVKDGPVAESHGNPDKKNSKDLVVFPQTHIIKGFYFLASAVYQSRIGIIDF